MTACGAAQDTVPWHGGALLVFVEFRSESRSGRRAQGQALCHRHRHQARGRRAAPRSSPADHAYADRGSPQHCDPAEGPTPPRPRRRRLMDCPGRSQRVLLARCRLEAGVAAQARRVDPSGCSRRKSSTRSRASSALCSSSAERFARTETVQPAPHSSSNPALRKPSMYTASISGEKSAPAYFSSLVIVNPG